MLNELKSFVGGSRLETEEIVALSSFGRAYEAEFKENNMEAPKWVVNSNTAIAKELKARNQEAIASKLQAAKARLETLKSPDEKRKAVEDEIARLTQLQAEA